jgi:hypothetical protein
LRRVRRAALASLALVALLALAAGCGGEDAAGGAAAPSTADSGAVEPVRPATTAAPDIEPTGAIWEALPGSCREDLDGFDATWVKQAGALAAAKQAGKPAAQRKKLERKLAALEMQYITHSNVCINDVSDWSKAAHPLEELLGEAASASADIDVQVMCEQPLQWKLSTLDSLLAGWEELGFVMSGETIVHLSPRTCLMLDSLLAADDPAIPCLQQEMARKPERACPPGVAEQAFAVVTLTHEAHHAAGSLNEAKTQCYALQRADIAAEALGVAKDDAALIGAFELREVELPPEYVDKQCKRGGKLDIEPETKAFP